MRYIPMAPFSGVMVMYVNRSPWVRSLVVLLAFFTITMTVPAALGGEDINPERGQGACFVPRNGFNDRLPEESPITQEPLRVARDPSPKADRFNPVQSNPDGDRPLQGPQPSIRETDFYKVYPKNADFGSGWVGYYSTATSYYRTSGLVKVGKEGDLIARGFSVFDVSGVPDKDKIIGVSLNLTVNVSSGSSHSMNVSGIAQDPTTLPEDNSSNQTLYDAVFSGTSYYVNSQILRSPAGTKGSVELNTQARDDLKAAIDGTGTFILGMNEYTETDQGGWGMFQGYLDNQTDPEFPPHLYITYATGNMPPTVDVIQPDGVSDGATGEYPIEFNVTDPDTSPEDLLVSIYYGNLSSPLNIPIVEDRALNLFALNQSGNYQYYWDVSMLPFDSYNVLVEVEDTLSGLTVNDTSDGPLILNGEPTINLNVLTTDMGAQAIDQFTITWEATDPEGTAQIDLEYDDDQIPNSGNEYSIISALTFGTVEYIWDVSAIEGTYYIRAYIDDGVSRVGDVSDFPLVISHNIPPLIYMEVPAGPDVVADDQFNIEWTHQDDDGDPLDIRLYYDTNNNVSDGGYTEIAQPGSSESSYLWDIPVAISGMFYLLATVDDGVVEQPSFDYSDHPLIINHPPSIRFTYPSPSAGPGNNADEFFNISWQISDPEGAADDVQVELYHSRDRVSQDGSIGTFKGSGFYLWDTSQLTGEHYIVAQLNDGICPTVPMVTSDAAVMINHAPTINITAPPEGGASADDSYLITWSAQDPDPGDHPEITLFYGTDPQGFGYKAITTTPLNMTEAAGSYLWDTSSLDEGNYYIKAVIKDKLHPEIHQISPGSLSVDHPDRATMYNGKALVSGGESSMEDGPAILFVLYYSDLDGDEPSSIKVVVDEVTTRAMQNIDLTPLSQSQDMLDLTTMLQSEGLVVNTAATDGIVENGEVYVATPDLEGGPYSYFFEVFSGGEEALAEDSTPTRDNPLTVTVPDIGSTGDDDEPSADDDDTSDDDDDDTSDADDDDGSDDDDTSDADDDDGSDDDDDDGSDDDDDGSDDGGFLGSYLWLLILIVVIVVVVLMVIIAVVKKGGSDQGRNQYYDDDEEDEYDDTVDQDDAGYDGEEGFEFDDGFGGGGRSGSTAGGYEDSGDIFDRKGKVEFTGNDEPKLLLPPATSQEPAGYGDGFGAGYGADGYNQQSYPSHGGVGYGEYDTAQPGVAPQPPMTQYEIFPPGQSHQGQQSFQGDAQMGTGAGQTGKINNLDMTDMTEEEVMDDIFGDLEDE